MHRVAQLAALAGLGVDGLADFRVFRRREDGGGEGCGGDGGGVGAGCDQRGEEGLVEGAVVVGVGRWGGAGGELGEGGGEVGLEDGGDGGFGGGGGGGEGGA